MSHRLANKMLFTLLTAISLTITACSDPNNNNTSEKLDRGSTSLNPKVVTAADLPENAPEVGTDIKTLINTDKTDSNSEDSKVKNITWEQLIPPGYSAAVVMKKYQKQIDALPEGAPEEKALLDKIMAEFNNAPANKALHGQKIRLPGFISPLDEQDGMVKEFLLVPYFGSCIHSPPPPINQTLLVTPDTGKSVRMDDIYEPVWVTGDMVVEMQNTDLAQAGYLIKNAQVVKFLEDDEYIGQQPEEPEEEIIDDTEETSAEKPE